MVSPDQIDFIHGYLVAYKPIQIQTSYKSWSNLLLFQWTIADYGCMTYSMVAVPLYDTLGEDAMVHTVQISK